MTRRPCKCLICTSLLIFFALSIIIFLSGGFFNGVPTSVSSIDRYLLPALSDVSFWFGTSGRSDATCLLAYLWYVMCLIQSCLPSCLVTTQLEFFMISSVFLDGCSRSDYEIIIFLIAVCIGFMPSMYLRFSSPYQPYPGRNCNSLSVSYSDFSYTHV